VFDWARAGIHYYETSTTYHPMGLKINKASSHPWYGPLPNHSTSFVGWDTLDTDHVERSWIVRYRTKKVVEHATTKAQVEALRSKDRHVDAVRRQVAALSVQGQKVSRCAVVPTIRKQLTLRKCVGTLSVSHVAPPVSRAVTVVSCLARTEVKTFTLRPFWVSEFGGRPRACHDHNDAEIGPLMRYNRVMLAVQDDWSHSQKELNKAQHSLNGNIFGAIGAFFGFFAPLGWPGLVLALHRVPIQPSFAVFVLGYAVQAIIMSWQFVFFTPGVGVWYPEFLTHVPWLLTAIRVMGAEQANWVQVFYSAFTFRIIVSFIRRIIISIYNQLSYPRFRSFVIFFVDSFELAAYLTGFWFLYVSTTAVWYTATVAGGLSVWFLLTLFLPLVVALGFVFVFMALELSFYVFLGVPLGTFNAFWYFSHVWMLFRRLFHLVHALPLLAKVSVELTVAALWVCIQGVRLPLDIMTYILDDSHEVDPHVKYFRFFWTRFFLGLDLAICRVLGLTTIMAATAGLSLSLTIIVLFYFSITNGNMMFAPITVIWVSFLAAFKMPVAVMFDFFNRRVKVAVVKNALWCLNIGSTYNFRIPRVNGAPRLINPGSNIEALNDFDLQLAFSRVIFDLSGFYTPTVALLALLMFTKFILSTTYKVGKHVLRAPIVLLDAIVFFLVPFVLPDIVFVWGWTMFYLLLGFVSSDGSGIYAIVKSYFRLIGAGSLLGVHYYGPIEQLRGGSAPAAKLSQIFVKSWVSLTRRSVLKFVEYTDKIRLPEMVQAAYKPPSLDSIRSTYSTMQGMGFPIDQTFIDSLSSPNNSTYLAEWGSWRNWLIGTSNFKLGFRDVPVTFHSWLPSNFFPEVPGYIHTTTYTGVAEEIISTARYFTGNHTKHTLGSQEEFDDLVDDVWEGVKVQYADSKLSTFNDIYRAWVKRYNMGFGFGYYNPKTNRLRQLTRQAVIDSMGGKKPFLKAWEKVFYNAQKLLLPSPVFTKWETLKLKKSINRSVRTVVGSAFVHHVATTVFNYKPNHNYHPWETPSKVGMPINGQNYNRLWESMLRHEKVFAGDMTAFDSSQAPVILKVCAAIRKMGYSLHQDSERIFQLIDLTYEQLRDQPMAFKNFGDIAIKGQGATTGHSSTTPDNTIMLLANYLFAWRRVTGLRAREFFNFNTLANFGDDHVLGYDSVFGWTPEAAWRAMEEIGTIMRDEAPGITSLPIPGQMPPGMKDWRENKFSFLAKLPLPMTPDVKGELSAAGVTIPLTFATCHDKGRLLGKAKGQVLASKAKDPFSSYQALISYIYMSAHHKDVYDELAHEAVAMHTRLVGQFKADKRSLAKLPRPPSYNAVLRQWYASEPFPYLNDDLESQADDTDKVYVFSNPDPFSLFVRWISDFPTMLSPRYRNTRWADWVQTKLADHLSWPLTFIAYANGTQNDLMTSKLLLSRTPYSFLRNDTIVIKEDIYGRLLFRHWCYVALTRVFTYRKAFSPLDLIRLFDSFYINSIYVSFGKVSQVLVELDLHILDTIIVFLLSKIFVELPIPPILIDFMSPSQWVGYVFTYIIGLFQPSGSIDFQPLDEQIRHLRNRPDASFVLDAPTGVGKSTRMVNRMQEVSGCRVVVIVPRHLVCVSVAKYMQEMYPNSGISAQTEGHTSLASDRITYCTGQSFFLNAHLRDPNNIIILDEAHIEEPMYEVLRKYLDNPTIRRIYMTATPPTGLGVPTLTLPAISSFNVASKVVKDHTMERYLKAAAGFANDRTSLEKILIFVPSMKNMDLLAGMVMHKVCRLSSQHKIIDPTATVYITTNVADAGLTIPDVSFVLSPDIDVTVTSPYYPGAGEASGKPQSLHYFFKLSDSTIKQRRGRTGRTSNGTFILFNITDLETSERSFSLLDYISAVAPATSQCAPFFPQSVTIGAPQDWQYTLRSYAVAPNAFSDGIFKRVSEIHRMAGRIRQSFVERHGFIPPQMEAYVDDKTKDGASVTLATHAKESGGALQDPEGTRVIGKFPPDVGPVEHWNGTSESLFDQTPTLEDPVPPPGQSKVMRRVNVSGSGLYCGARCVRGLVWTKMGILLSEQIIIQGLIDTIPQDFRDMPGQDFTNNFGWEQIRDYLYDTFGIAVTEFNFGGEWQQIYPGFVNVPAEQRATLYLDQDNGHWNYLGYPVPDLNGDDSRYDEATNFY